MNSASTRRFLTIVLGAMLLSCLLGIALDLVTANTAVAYFSVHHPRIVASDDPWVLAVVWGVAASWWFGLIAGIIVAFINHRRREPLPPRRILTWAALASAILWLVMIAILVTILILSSRIPLDQRRPTFESDRRLVAVAMAHQFEYLLGGIALIIIAIATWRARSTPPSNLTLPSTAEPTSSPPETSPPPPPTRM